MTTMYLTPQDRADYGDELLDVSQRAAMQAVAPWLQQLQAENADLRARQAREQRRRLDSQVAQAVPNYRVFDQDPRWHQWLLWPDRLSGRVRQQLLDEAIASGDTRRVVAFFKGFEAEPASSFEPSSSARAPSRSGTGTRTASRRSVT
jgi:hypothetical protein